MNPTVARCSSPLSGSTNKAANSPRLNYAPLWALLATYVPDRADQRESDSAGRLHGGSKESSFPLIEAQLTGISPLGLEGYEEAQTAEGIVFYRQGWRCRMR
jgi:hypothetical protein